MADQTQSKTWKEFVELIQSQTELFTLYRKKIGNTTQFFASNSQISIKTSDKENIVTVTVNKNDTTYCKDNHFVTPVITQKNRDVLISSLNKKVEDMNSIDFADKQNIKFTSKEGIGKIVISSKPIKNDLLNANMTTVEIYLNDIKEKEYHLTEAELDSFTNTLAARYGYLIQKIKVNLGINGSNGR
ncbi:MAG: hypothetical protein MJ156_02130 [Alphaproteobacteria bacterium]|nr:hypothetical protein [Alphaproteobacteria bacterium]